jgi:hypothetical protein
MKSTYAYIIIFFAVIIIAAILIQTLPNSCEGFTSSVDLYRDPSVDDYGTTLNELRQTLSDSRDMLVMNRCVSLDGGFFDSLDSYIAKANYHIKRFDILLEPNTSGAVSFRDVQTRIKQEIFSMYEQLNMANSPTTPKTKLPSPIYTMVFQAPYYPDISLMNWQVGNKGFEYLPFDGSKYNSSDHIKINVTTVMLFPKCAKDGTPLPNINEAEIANKLQAIFQNVTTDQLCFMHCLGNPELACGCRSQTVKSADGSKVLYTSKCLSSEGSGDAIGNYGVIYQLNPNYPEFVSRGVFESGADVHVQESGLMEYPPIGVAKGSRWFRDTGDTVVGLGNRAFAKYKTTVSSGGYGKGSYTAWASSVWGYGNNNIDNEWSPSGAFDKEQGDRPTTGGGGAGWHVAENLNIYTKDVDARNPPYLALELPNPVILREYSLQVRAYCCVEQMPTKWRLYGTTTPSKDSTWTLIESRENVFWSALGEEKRFKTPNKKAFKAYKIEVVRNGSPWPNFMHIGEWRIFAQSDGRGSGATTAYDLSNGKPSYLVSSDSRGIWGNNAFQDKTAKWIWNTPGAASNASVGPYILFKRVYNNTANKEVKATVHIVVDNYGKLFLNNEYLKDVGGGWGEANYPKVSVTLKPGQNLFGFNCINAGGPAGLIYSVIEDGTNKVLLNSDASTLFF